jgi:hypothetical protein
MTASERRWAEIRLFYFCLDIYRLRHDLMDVAYAIDTIAQIGNFKRERLKHISAKLISDPTNMPTDTEFIHIASENGLTNSYIAETIGKSRAHICQVLKRKEAPAYSPLMSEEDDIEINKFIILLDKFQKAGI